MHRSAPLLRRRVHRRGRGALGAAGRALPDPHHPPRLVVTVGRLHDGAARICTICRWLDRGVERHDDARVRERRGRHGRRDARDAEACNNRARAVELQLERPRPRSFQLEVERRLTTELRRLPRGPASVAASARGTTVTQNSAGQLNFWQRARTSSRKKKRFPPRNRAINSKKATRGSHIIPRPGSVDTSTVGTIVTQSSAGRRRESSIYTKIQPPQHQKTQRRAQPPSPSFTQLRSF